MITYKKIINNIFEIIYINSVYIISYATNRQFKSELNEYTICVIRMYIKRCQKGFNDDIIKIYKKHIEELIKNYEEKTK